MKHQYFGDINDYRKYGLFRFLTTGSGLSTCVCWMLTPDEGGADGRHIDYLRERKLETVRRDPPLFEALHDVVIRQQQRTVEVVSALELLPRTCTFGEILPDDKAARSEYFERLWVCAKGRDLIFFDPDNGMEIASRPRGRKRSSKFLFWDELKAAAGRGYSVLVYQHFPREKRSVYLKRMTKRMKAVSKKHKVYSLANPRVVFFLLVAREHKQLENRLRSFAAIWDEFDVV